MYEIQVLNDKEFEKLSYKNLEDSLGVADPKNKKGYVRYTGLKELDQYLVNHELEHLVEGGGGKHADHYKDGVYYKKTGRLFSSLGAGAGGAALGSMLLAPFLGPFAPLVGMTAGQLGGSLGGAAASGLVGAGQADKDRRGAMKEQSRRQQAPIGGPLQSFRPQAPAAQNIVQSDGGPGAGEGGGGGVQAPGGNRGGFMDRVKGFFSSRAGGIF